MPEKARVEHERSMLLFAVRISAAIMFVLLAVFFIIVMRNIYTVNSQVEYVKNSPYPISVAAGHIETELVHLRSYIQGEITRSPDSADVSPSQKKADLNEITDYLTEQLEIIKESSRANDVDSERMDKLLDLIKTRIDNYFADTGKDAQGAYTSLGQYGTNYISPVIDSMLEIDNKVIDLSSQRVEEMYTEVSNSSSVLFYFTLVMSVATLVIFIVLLVVIRNMNRFEQNLREELTRSLMETEHANQAKSSFLANMSHDIRTPMNAIFGHTQIALENIDDTLRVKQCLTRITTSSQHLLSLINDVLDMNKIESGKVTLSKETFSLTALADEIDAMFQSQADAKKREAEVVMDGIFADLLVGDAMRLRQILLNLVSNALKYTNEGDVTRLTVKERRIPDPSKAAVTFMVEDSGIGMQKGFIDHIFEPFEREKNEFTNFTEGTGLGMAITKNIVDLMGGDIKVESELGLGTKVTIDIVFKIADSSNADAQDPIKTALASQTDQEGEESPKERQKLSVKGNVLIVEDNEINMEIAKALITSRGATVEEAYNGIEALNAISASEEGQYDLIFMDWQMPHMNGIEATKAIREHLAERGREQIPIVAMTANAFESDRQTAMEAGMNDFMAKPINIHQLEDVLKKYLHYNS